MYIEISTGTKLHAELTTPNSSANSGNKLAVCLHPYAFLGGRMTDPVLLSLTDSLLHHNYHILRYNTRGFGGSSGWPSLSGLSEGKDLEALVDWGIKEIKNVQSVLIIGYSYGSLITTLFPPLPSPIKTSYALLSYPFGTRGLLTLFNSNTYSQKLRDLVQNPNGNVFVIFGDSDEFTSSSKYKSWAEELQADVRNGAKLEVVTVPGASHFWHGSSGDRLVSHFENWLRNTD